MISRSTRRGLLLLIALSVLSFWAARRQGPDDGGPTPGLDVRLNYALTDFEMYIFDEDGAPAAHLVAPRLANDADTDIANISAPRIELRHAGFVWNIIADSAVVSEDRELIHLGGEVNINRRGMTPDEWLMIDTRAVTLKVSPRLARSEEQLTMASLAGRLTAKGFVLDMLGDRFQLLSDVEGVYVLP